MGDRVAQAAKANALRALHHGATPLVLPNIWDVASARVVEDAGAKVIATGSAGVAYVLGYADGQRIPPHEMIAMVSRIASAVKVPVTADVEAGYGDATGTALELLAAGAAGMNLEDYADSQLIPVETQVRTIRAIRAAVNSAGVPMVLNARTEIYLAGIGDPSTRFERAVERLNQYRDAGADCLFAPGVRDAETIGRLVKAIRGPLNILAGPGSPSISELAQLGVARVSVGSGPMRAALGLMRRIANELLNEGTYASLGEGAIPYAEMNRLMER